MDPTIYGDTGGADLSTSTTDGSFVPLPDVSLGAPSMSPTTPTGNGTGYFIDPALQAQGFDFLKSGLNFVLQKDALNMQAQRLPTYQQQATYGIQRQTLTSNNSLLLLAGVAMMFILMRHN